MDRISERSELGSTWRTLGEPLKNKKPNQIGEPLKSKNPLHLSHKHKPIVLKIEVFYVCSLLRSTIMKSVYLNGSRPH